MHSPVLNASKLSAQSASEISEMILATILPPHDIWSCYTLAVKVQTFLLAWYFVEL